MNERSPPDVSSVLADEIEDSYSGNFVQDILLDEWDRKLIVAALRARLALARGDVVAQPKLDPLREVLEFWMDRTRLQTFEDRERFRKAASEALAIPSTTRETPEFNLGAYIDDNTDDRR